MATTEGLRAVPGLVVYMMTPAEATDLARHIRRLTDLEGERDIAGCLSHLADDLIFTAGAAVERRNLNESEARINDSRHNAGLPPLGGAL